MSTVALIHRLGTRAAQPAANTVGIGTLYFVTDEEVIERSDGTTWVTYSGTGGGGGSGSLVLLETKTAAGSASLDFVNISATYDDYIFKILGIIPANDNTDLLIRCSTDAGASFDSGANYARQIRLDSNAFNAVDGADSGLTSINLIANIDNTTTQASVNGSLEMFNPLSATLYTSFIFHGYAKNNDGRFYNKIGNGTYLSATPVNAIRFVMSAGNIASGVIRMYGIVK